MKNLLTILTGMLILLFSLSANAEWTTKDQGKIQQLEAAQEKAQADGEKIASIAKVISEYNSENNQYQNQMPTRIDGVKALIEKNESFRDDQLADANEKFEEMFSEYGINSFDDLQQKISENLNPSEWTGMQQSVPFSAYQIKTAVETFETFEKDAKAAMSYAQANEADEAKRNVKKTSQFPANSFDDDGDLADLQMQAKKSLVSGKVDESDMINVAITSGWTDGVFPITKIPFRTIRGSVLFQDTDDDGLCRFNGYTFISINGEELEYKAVRGGGGGGYANCDDGASANGGLQAGSGFISSMIWILLVAVNLIGGALILKDKLSSVAQLQSILSLLQQNQTLIGLASIGLGIFGFLISFLSLNLLESIIPQVSAVLIGAILSSQFLISKREAAGETIAKIQPFTQSLGIAAVAVAGTHLVLSGGLYFI